MDTAAQSYPEPDLEPVPSTVDGPESRVSATTTAAPTSSPTVPVYLTLKPQLPDGYRLVSLHRMYDGTWNVTVAVEPGVLDADGRSLGYSDYYGSGRHADVNLACHDAIAMVDWRRANQVSMKKTVLPVRSTQVTRQELKIDDLDLSNLDIKL